MKKRNNSIVHPHQLKLDELYSKGATNIAICECGKFYKRTYNTSGRQYIYTECQGCRRQRKFKCAKNC